MSHAALIERINKLPEDKLAEVDKLVAELLHQDFLAQYNKEIDEAMARMDAGQFTTHDEVKRQSEHW